MIYAHVQCGHAPLLFVALHLDRGFLTGGKFHPCSGKILSDLVQ